jgi:SAM-dependent methyltransferase
MLDIIKKAEYFDWLDKNIADPKNYSLKGIQDGWILSLFSEKSQLKIAEVGGGHSRVLSKLSQQNECWNIDKFEGLGQGPTDIAGISDFKVVRAYLGDFDPAIPDQYFDVVFSISVVEHVAKAKLDAFFADCYRILKPGGMMVHAIDLYIPDTPNPQALAIVEAYRQSIERQPFEWLTPPAIDQQATFRCSFASNSDITMNHWNKIVPTLRSLRETSQSVAIKLVALKPAQADAPLPDLVAALRSQPAPATVGTPAEPPRSPAAGQSSASPAPATTATRSTRSTPPEQLPPPSPLTLATALIQRILHYYSRWPIALAGLAIVLNTVALLDEVPLRWVFMVGGTLMLLVLVGHAASKADYVLAEVEQLRSQQSTPTVKKRKP